MRRTPAHSLTTCVAVLAALLLLPLLITLATSLATPQWVMAHYRGDVRAIWTPDLTLTFAQYRLLLSDLSSYAPPILASFCYAAITTLAHLAISLVTAFCLAKVKARGFAFVSFLYLVAMVCPIQVLLLPSYIVLDILSLTDSWSSLYITAMFAPFGVFFLRQAFVTLEDTHIDAALLETSGVFTLVFRIAAPCVSPSVVALGALAFSEAWSTIEQPMIMLSPSQVMPIATVLTDMVRYGNIEAIFAYSVAAILPVAAVYALTRKSLFAALENFHF